MEHLQKFIIDLIGQPSSKEELSRTAESISDTCGISYISSLPMVLRNLSLFDIKEPNQEQERQKHNAQSAYKSAFAQAEVRVENFFPTAEVMHEEKIFVRLLLEIFVLQEKIISAERMEAFLHLCCKNAYPLK